MRAKRNGKDANLMDWLCDSLSTSDHGPVPLIAISGNKLKVVFEANETAEERPIQLTVTAGDCFYTFKFKQFAN